ncbi:transporter substrate-binding domain-containing protein [Alcanivorax sp. S6407]|uniref:transporter substrate-binding domain-containing protein n=1 Tax=Alcanivorax sp. S6407 TaxID=2926424 RepID=UPI001FF5AC96|nr:transporter substrate-binding domain-containing protein [Alcanivorax sp. S6407]MCK0152240.1 transporter substrate-binding domain-containing protein [Alcanivorax sp. S6407]
MRLGLMLIFSLWLALLAGCDSPEPEVGEAVSTFENYQDTGDLSDLRERGYIRLLAPRFDEPSGLPRDGIPSEDYQLQAEAFVRSLNMEPRWVYADDFDQLDELLNAGSADIIVTNYSVTDTRKKTLAFSTPVNSVQEKLVIPAALADTPVSEMETLVISVPAGTAYQETAEKLARRHEHVSVEVMDSNLSDEELVAAVASGELAATIVDSNMLDILLDNQDVSNAAVAGPVVNRKRRIAWAVRKDSAELLDKINQYITSERVITSVDQPELRDWEAIQKKGVLRVITSNNPASYFMWRGELMGFDYELIRHFAKQHRLRVSVKVKESPSAMFEALQAGEGDVIAASMTHTQEREQQGWMFSKRYLEINEQLIGRADDTPLESLENLAGRAVAVSPDSAFLETLTALKQDGLAFDIITVEGVTTEQLIDAVAHGVYDLTMADSHLAAMEATYRDDIAVLYQFEPAKDIAWGLRPEQQTLKAQLDKYISRNYRGLFYNVTFNRYFKEKKTIANHVEYRITAGKEISPFDDLVKDESLKYGLDWRLITSQMYQESRFNPKARSFAGAQGLLQVMPRTGRQFGYSNLTNPQNGVEAGLAYMDWLEQRFPARLDLAEKLYFTLAAYNAGHGHVEDARRLAERIGKDPDKWFGNVEQAMLLLSKPQYARQARYGYVRGSEPVKYVREIKNRYLGYVEALGESS